MPLATKRLGAALMLAVVVGFWPAAVRAGTILPPRTLATLAQTSDAVVLARAGASVSAVRGGLIFTETTFEALDVVAGPVGPGATFRVAAPGGMAQGYGWRVAGSPEFAPDGVYLLFLDQQPDGAWQPQVLSYGLLERVAGPAGEPLLTHLAETHDLELLKRPDGTQPEPIGTYAEAGLLGHLRAVLAGQERWQASKVLADEPVHATPHGAAAKHAAIPEPCTFITYQGDPIRWNSFDSGGSVNFFAEENGDADLGGGGLTAVQEGLDAWNDLPGLTLDYEWGGGAAYTPDCSDGSATPNNIDVDQGLVQFNDPCGQIPDISPQCTGTLALGGAFFLVDTESQHEHRAMTWNTNVVGYVIVNNGAAVCLSGAEYELMMMHELGHTLGFGHVPSSAGAALMNPSCCNDLSEIDATCAAFAYDTSALPSVPVPVEPLLPANAAVEQPLSPTLEWIDNPDATSYEIEVSLDHQFTEVVYEEDEVLGTRRPIGPLAPNTQYYWHVRGANALGVGPWSTTFYFTTELVPPGIVALQAPAPDAIDQPWTVAFSWEGLLGADTYHLQVARDAGFEEIVFEEETLAETAHDVGPLAEASTFYWRVRAANGAGAGAWSDVRRLTTLPPLPGAFALRAPADGAVDESETLVLEWQRNPQAESYQVQIATDDLFAALELDAEGVAEERLAVGPLHGSTTYFWRVRGVNRAGAGPWSGARFTTRLTRPDAGVPLAPADGQRGLPPVVGLAWAADLQATTYDLQVARDDRFEDVVFDAEALAGTEIEVGPLPGDVRYYWHVRAVNEIGAGPWSPAWQFRTAIAFPSQIALVAPTDGEPGTSAYVAFRWEADVNATRYHLQVSLDDQFTQLVFEDQELTGLEQEVGPLVYDTPYVWRVRGLSGLGAGPWSAAWHFRTGVGTAVGDEPGLPDAFQLYANYPNPFNPQTTLHFDVPARGPVSLVIYDVLGRVVEVLAEGVLPAGRHRAVWDAGDLPSGLYLARLEAGTFSQTRQLTLLK